ncbi:hypothetical protein SpCBS45565_g01865 [Spizellomyces sp. 'palustris']|nr:hypothetical protein SpCBS45565_g01865 [Spizellomyces sp. 'palustris']
MSDNIIVNSTQEAHPLSSTMSANDKINVDSMQEPTWSTPAATKALQRELRRIHKTQCETPEAERGWSVDMDALTNLYQ